MSTTNYGKIYQECARIQQGKTTLRQAIASKGITLPADATIEDYHLYIESLFSAFEFLSGNITTIIMPDTITTLAPYRFYNFTQLTLVDMNDITTVAMHLCDGCTNLATLTLNTNTTAIKDYAFNNCKKLYPINIPQAITEIGSYAFNYAGYDKGETNTFNLVLTNNCEIGSSAFTNTFLASIDGFFSSIGSSAFNGLTKLTSVAIKNATSIDSYAFSDDYYVETFSFTPTINLTSLGSYAFRNFGSKRTSTGIFQFDLSNSSFTSVQSYTFSGNSTNKNKNFEVYLPETVTSIGSSAFAYNENLKLFLNSSPTLSSSSTFSENTNLKVFTRLDEVGTLKEMTNWLSLADNIFAYVRGNEIGAGNNLPLYTTIDGLGITWYTDETMTTQLTNLAVTESNVNNNFYATTTATRQVWWFKKLTALNCTLSVSDGTNTYTSGDAIPVGTTVTITATPTDTTKNQLYLFQVNGETKTNGCSIEVTEDLSVVAVYWDGVNYPFMTTLGDNTFSMIAQCCRLGLNSNVWTLGDTFSITLTNGDIVTARYCDDTAGRYQYTDGTGDTHAVFEIVELIRLNANTTKFIFNSSSNTDDDDCYNNWSISQLRTRMNSGDIYNLLPDDFKAILKPVNIKTAKNGNSSTLVTTSDSLFLPAEKELFSSRSCSRQNEWDALGSQFTLYANNNTDAYRVKKRYGTTEGYYWWERSPYSGYSYFVCYVDSSGSASGYHASYSFGVSPCFAL